MRGLTCASRSCGITHAAATRHANAVRRSTRFMRFSMRPAWRDPSSVSVQFRTRAGSLNRSGVPVRPDKRRLPVGLEQVARRRAIEVDEAAQAAMNRRLGALDAALWIDQQAGDGVMQQK